MMIMEVGLPGHRVVYVSDSFKGLTLYSKKEFIRHSCSILQGKCTNKPQVRRLHEAIARGEQVDSHLLNYRRDGTPFWNRFMALPIKSSDGRVTHYVGIQQDVTLLSEMSSHPHRWTPPEVGRWLEHVGLGEFSLKAIEHAILGEELFLKGADYVGDCLNITNEDDRVYLQQKINLLKKNPQFSFSNSFSSPNSSASLSFLRRDGSFNQGPICSRKKVQFDSKTFYHTNSKEKIMVRCIFKGKTSTFLRSGDTIHLFSIKRTSTLKKLRNKIQASFAKSNCHLYQIHREHLSPGSSSKIHSLCPDGKESIIFPICTDDDLLKAIGRAATGTHVTGSPRMQLRLVQAEEEERWMQSVQTPASTFSLLSTSPFFSSSVPSALPSFFSAQNHE